MGGQSQVQLARGKVVTALSAVEATTTSKAFRANGHNAILVHCNLTGGAWTVKLQGAPTYDGNYADIYDQNNIQMATSSLSADAVKLFVGIPENFKIVATEDTDTGAMTVTYETFTV